MAMERIRPDEVYNLGAQSHVRVSFDQPLYTADVVGLSALFVYSSRATIESFKAGSLLPGVERDVRSSSSTAGPRHPIPSPQPVCLRKVIATGKR